MKAALHDAPSFRGKQVDSCMLVDSQHADNKNTMISRTGFMIYMNI